ncbi:MAG: DUF2254 domain-containing protein [Aridibacter sp.]
MTKSENLWNHLISTLWFVPMFLVLAGVILGFSFVGVDYLIGDRLGYYPRLFGIHPSGARDLLAVIANSTMTIAVTAFSITIVALTLASSQFSPRILRNFMRDTGNQIVLGILVGIFAYCIIVLRTIRDASGENDSGFVPSVSVVFGIILGFVAIGCLIYFIHHVAISIQATSIISLIAKETLAEIKSNFPTGEDSTEIDKQTAHLLSSDDYLEINANETGYFQNADAHELVRLAVKYDLLITMQRKIGQFIIEGMPIMRVFSFQKGFRPDEKLVGKIISDYEVDNFRTVEGDVAFGLRQLVDIALKALSPAVNDTTTGVICVNYLTAILYELAKRPSCPSYFFEDGKLRLVLEQQGFEDYFDLAFNQIRQNAGGNVTVILVQLNSLRILSKINTTLKFKAERRMRHKLMETQADLLFNLAEKTVSADADLKTVTRYYENVQKSLAAKKREI